MVSCPSLEEMIEARAVVSKVALHTPLIPLREDFIYLKPEIHQCVHSFKIRGVFNAVQCMSDEERKRGISTVSAGNTAQALAWVGRHFGIKSKSIMPEGAPQTKIDAVRALGGTPVLVPTHEVFRYLKESLWNNDIESFVHPWIDRRVIIGHASMGLEIIEDLPDVDSVFVPVGGGALICGVGAAIKALKPSVKVIGVEPSGCAALRESLRKGEPASVDCQTMCDGVAVPYVTQELFPLLSSLVDDVITIEESEVKDAIRELALSHKMIAEGSGALAFAAAKKVPVSERGHSVCLITGGSLNLDKLIEILRGSETNPAS